MILASYGAAAEKQNPSGVRQLAEGVYMVAPSGRRE